ncbi:hypothetical protein LTR95_005479 [Oleoguttula sp. CCFEE 5521]
MPPALEDHIVLKIYHQLFAENRPVAEVAAKSGVNLHVEVSKAMVAKRRILSFDDENRVLRTENNCLERDLAEARVKLHEDVRTFRGLTEKFRLLVLQRQVLQESPNMPKEARDFLARSHSKVSEALKR